MPERQTDAASARLIKRNGERNRRSPNKKLQIPKSTKEKSRKQGGESERQKKNELLIQH